MLKNSFEDSSISSTSYSSDYESSSTGFKNYDFCKENKPISDSYSDDLSPISFQELPFHQKMLSFDRTYLESKLQQHCFDVDTDNFAKKAIVQNPILDPTNYNQRCWNSSTNTSVERWNCLKDQVQAIESQTFNLQNNPEIPQSSKKFGFRSVKPPQPKTHEDTRTAIPENNSTQHAKIEQQDIFASRNYEEKIKKGWSPVKFNPHSPQTSSGEIACFSGRSRPGW